MPKNNKTFYTSHSMFHFSLSGSRLAKNTLFNFIGQAVPLVVGVVTIPFIVRGLGTERFGLLSLAWVILGYFAIFDLGLGRATTKFVAEALGKGEEKEIPRIVWTAVTVQALLGAVGGLALTGITPLLVERILNIPRAGKRGKGHLLPPFPFCAGGLGLWPFRGVLEASQRFDLVNAVKIPLERSYFYSSSGRVALGPAAAGNRGLDTGGTGWGPRFLCSSQFSRF